VLASQFPVALLQMPYRIEATPGIDLCCFNDALQLYKIVAQNEWVEM
jgi:hypothetical protein